MISGALTGNGMPWCIGAWDVGKVGAGSGNLDLIGPAKIEGNT